MMMEGKNSEALLVKIIVPKHVEIGLVYVHTKGNHFFHASTKIGDKERYGLWIMSW